MQTRSKVVELSGQSYQLKRLSPEVGSFIFFRMLGAQIRSMANEEPPKQTDEKPKEEKPIDGETKVRALSFFVFSGGMSFDDFKFIQNACLQVVSVVKERAGEAFPLPIMDNGKWLPDGDVVMNDVGIVMKLTSEVLVHSLADFFDAGVNPGN